MWYVLQVNTGKESAVRDKLRELGFPVFVPQEERIIRKGGVWGAKCYTLFPGYVFLNMHYDADNYYRVKAALGVDRLSLLGPPGGPPSALTYLEAEWIKALSGYGDEPVKPSRVKISEGGSVQITDGVLQNFGSRITRIDQHSKRATVELTLCGERKTLQLSVEPFEDLNEIQTKPKETDG